MNEYTYKCPRKCPINKRCFIIKLAAPLKEKTTVLQKCPAVKRDIPIEIGGEHPP